MKWINSNWHPMTIQIIEFEYKFKSEKLSDESMVKVFDYVDLIIKQYYKKQENGN
jgi:hypothetical protein